MQREYYRANDNLSSKWTEINKVVITFNGLYHNAKNAPKYGETEGDFISNAFKSYQDEKNDEFKFMHCWDVMRHAAKWTRVPLASESSKRMKTSSSQTRSDAHDNEFDLKFDDNDFKEELSRPPDRDKSKKGPQRSPALGLGSGSGKSVAYIKQLNELNTHIVEFNIIQQKRLEEKKSIRDAFEKNEYKRKTEGYEIPRHACQSPFRSRVGNDITNETGNNVKI